MDITKLFRAYYECRRHKRNTRSATLFEMHYERELFRLADEVESRTYSPSPSVAFIVDYPVKREILAPAFRDRVIHHYLIAQLEEGFEKLFIHDSYACRKWKWTLFGIRRAEKHMRSCSGWYSKDAYILQLDIAWFFMSIDRGLLLSRVSQYVTSRFGGGGGANHIQEILYLLEQIILNDPIKNSIIRWKREDWVWLPRNKSLFFSSPGHGLPIGNLTSQVFANFYMHELDVYIRDTLWIQYYGRYVDDFFLMHNDRGYLLSCQERIRIFLISHLHLTLHPDKIRLTHIRSWFLFLGSYIKPYRTYIGNRTKNQWYHCIQKSNHQSEEKILSQMNSYLGMVAHFHTFSLRKKMCSVFMMLDSRFSLASEYQKICKRKYDEYISMNL